MFCVLVFFLRSKTYRKKRKSWLEIVLITSFYYTNDMYPYNRAYWEFICTHLFLLVILCNFLSVCENKRAYEYHHLQQIFYHQNMKMIFRWFRMFPFYVFLPWILLILCLIIFLLNSVSLNSLNTFPVFTLYAVLDPLPSIFFVEYIFEFNPTNPSIIFPSDSSFILPINYLLALSKNFKSFG